MKIRIAPHHHTGRFLPSWHTSYGLLVALLIIIGLALPHLIDRATASQLASDTLLVSAKVAPTSAPTITNPVNGQQFSTSPIKVTGTCQNGLVVKIFRNGIFAGSAICSSGRFDLSIELTPGRNDLTAREYTLDGQGGPSSPTVTVYLSGAVTGQSLIITSDTAFEGAAPGGELSWPIQVLGGQSPYALSWDWGDGTSDVASLNAAGHYTAKHRYKAGGHYNIVIKATDAQGAQAYLQVMAVISSPAAAPITESGGILEVLWPLYILLILLLGVFWLGEHRGNRDARQREQFGHS